MSVSLYKIKGEVINDSIELLFSTKKLSRDTKLVVGKLGNSDENLLEQTEIQDDDLSLSKEDKVKIGQELFVKLAEFLYNEKTTLVPVIHTKIYDKILDGREYQLIKYKHFYQQLKHMGFSISRRE